MVDIPEQWGIPTNLVMSALWFMSCVMPLQPKVPHNFALCVGSVLLEIRALVHNFGCPAFSLFSSISVFSFLFSCCRWTITLWRWLGEKREGQVGVWSASVPGFPLERTDQGTMGRRAVDVRFLPELALTHVLWKWRPICVPWKKPRPGVEGDSEPVPLTTRSYQL